MLQQLCLFLPYQVCLAFAVAIYMVFVVAGSLLAFVFGTVVDAVLWQVVWHSVLSYTPTLISCCCGCGVRCVARSSGKEGSPGCGRETSTNFFEVFDSLDYVRVCRLFLFAYNAFFPREAILSSSPSASLHIISYRMGCCRLATTEIRRSCIAIVRS